jgi:ceramide glucosyltransferase
VASPFEQPLGRRRLSEVWSRQIRWARLRRVTFPLFYAPEILLGAIPALAFALLAAACQDMSLLLTALAVLAAIYLPEYLLALANGWYAAPLLVPAMMVRDCILPFMWARGWMAGAVDWRGNEMNISTKSAELEETPSGA